MTHEEAKKMGATHIDDYGNYYLGIEKRAMTLWYQWIDREWQTPKSMFLNLKPL